MGKKPMPRPGRHKLILLLGLTALVCSASSYSCKGRPPAARRPVVLIAIDGLEWDVAIEMFRDGKLPNLAQQIRSGAFGELDTMHPSLSPAIWTSVATGLPPAQHGIRGFVKSGGKQPKLFTNRDRRTKALWNIAADHDLKSGVVGWWNTFPVEPLPGVMVAQSNATRQVAGQGANKDRGVLKGSLQQGWPHQVEPEALEDRFLALAGEVDANLDETFRRIFRKPEPTGTDAVARMWQESRWSLRADLEYERIALEILATRQNLDLFLVYFGGTDVLGHRFWRWAYPKQYQPAPDAKSIDAYGSILRDYYEYTDAVVGRLVAAAPEDAVIVVMSDHGMSAVGRKKRFDPEAPGRPPRSGAHGHSSAFFTISGPAIRSMPPVVPEELRRPDIPRLGSIFDVAPTMLALMGIPVGADMPGKVLADLIDPAFLEAHPLRKVPTHTPPGWFRKRVLPDVETPRSDERLEQLRSLGYIQ